MPDITQERDKLIGCVIRDIQHDEHGWHIIVEEEVALTHNAVFEIYPVLNHDGPNTIVSMQCEYLV